MGGLESAGYSPARAHAPPSVLLCMGVVGVGFQVALMGDTNDAAHKSRCNSLMVAKYVKNSCLTHSVIIFWLYSSESCALLKNNGSTRGRATAVCIQLL